MTLRPLKLPSLGPRDTSLQQHQRLEGQRQALGEERSALLALEQRLETITDEPRWNVNVPMGPLAWMPGQLVHTNTIKIRFSRDYVVEYSARQAKEVAARRRKALDEHIHKIEEAVKELDPKFKHEHNLPSDWTVNQNNEIITDSGDPCFEIREELPDEEDEVDLVQRRRHNALVERQEDDQELSRRPALSHQDLEDLFAQAEAEEVTERQRQEDSENEEPEPLSENDSKEDPYRETPKIVELDDKPVSSTPSPQLIEPTSPQPALKSILSNPKLDSDTNYSSREPPRRRKSVRLDVEGPQPEAEPSPPKPIRPLPSTSAPVKSSVVERPFQQSVKANVVERLRTSEETKSPHPKSFADANGTNSVDSDDDSDVDWNEWDSDGSEEDDWDALMLQRELAMQYHAKRYDLGAGMGTGALGGTGDSAAWQLGNQDYVPEDTSLATGQHTASQASRFAGGRMQNARLVVPDLLQQAGLEAGDVLDNAPWSSLHGRTYTAEEEARIQERIERLALGLDVSDDEPKPQVISLEDALAEAVEPPVCKASAAPVSDSVVEKSQSQQSPQPEASTSKPKRVSRFKSERSGQS